MKYKNNPVTITYKIISLTVLFLVLFVLSPGKVFSQSASNEANTVLQKIKDKVESIRKNPKAFIGSVTDKTESSLQIKSISGKIDQISVKSEVTFVKIAKTTTNIKFSDIGIGDFIVALGYTNGNSILEAQRILVTDPFTDPGRKILLGTITNINKRVVSITDKSGNQSDLTFPAKWNGPEIKDLKTGMNVVTVVLTDNNKLTVRTITVLVIEPTVTPSLKPKQNS